MTKPSLVGLIVAASLIATGAQAAEDQGRTAPGEPVCLHKAELTSLVTYALPVVIGTALVTCKPALAPNGFFATEGASLVSRYAAGKPAAWPAARGALLKLEAGKAGKFDNMLRKLPDSALQPLAEGFVSEAVAPALEPGRCRMLEQGMALVSPLPPESTAELVTYLFTIADRPGLTRRTGITLCKTGN